MLSSGKYLGVFWTAVAFLICRLCFLWAFNLETRLPVIKIGPKDSYFGYSVAEHQFAHDTGELENVLLIGAPKASTFRYNHSGAVYRCSISTYISEDCKQLIIDQNIDYRQQKVIREDQWLGVTVESQGPNGYVMACAHRFIIAGTDYQWGQGICFSLKSNLDFSRAWEPCKNRPVNKAHEQYGYCQAGTSGQITKDNTIVIGAPGPFTWRGTVFTNSVTFRITQGRDDKRWYAGALLDETSPVDKYSYLGMSVTSGEFFGGAVSFVGGAPRSEGVGQVIFFTKSRSGVTFVVQLVLDGEQFASSFGYSLASIDANQDGYLDLVVGAPFYFSKDNGGAVYIYMNSPEGLKESTKPIKLVGKPESRYGFAIENAGDLNQDGYPDLVIGAPYEDESGAVYVYLGSKDGLITTPSQVIRSSDIPKGQGLKTFGYSLDGGIDLDGNSYPDLLIGCYESNSVVLLRSRPVLDIITSVTGQLSNIDPDKAGCKEHPNSPSVCFSFEACFQFNSSLLDKAQAIKLKYKIEAETFTGQKYYRVRFNSSADSEAPNIVENEILMRGSSVLRQHCSSEIVYLKDKTDIQKPVQFKLSYSLIQNDPNIPLPGAPLPNVNDFPILNQQEASRIFQAKFLKDCGANDICESQLGVSADVNLPRDLQGQPILYLGEKEVALSVKVVNLGEPAYDAMLFVMHPASLSYVGRKIVRGDQIECVPSSATLVSCELGNPLKEKEVELQVRFNPKDVSSDDKNLALSVKVNTTSKDVDREDITIDIGVIKVAELVIGGISQPAQTFYGGDSSTVPAFEEDIGNEVIHVYEVINHGPWLATNFEVVINWPAEAQNGGEGKWLLYMTESPEVLGNGYCELDPSYLNPMKVKKHPQELRLAPEGYIVNQRRRKREIEPEELRADGKPARIVTLDCEHKTAKCFQFSCFFKSLERGKSAEVKIKSRLWNNTFVNDYAFVDWVSIISRAHILINSDEFQQKDDNDFTFVETKAYPEIDLYQKYDGIPLWIIIISACAGILLLVLLIVILWRCGFFKRKVAGYEPAPSSDKDFM